MFSSGLYSQTYMDKVAEGACECIESVSDTLSAKEYEIKLGLCMLSASEPYMKKIKKDLNIDFTKEGDAEKFGEKVGYKMASICPGQLMKAFENTNVDFEDDNQYVDSYYGEITAVKTESFIVFSMETTDGKNIKLYWITRAESNLDLANNYESLIGKTVEAYAHLAEIFDPRINEYRYVNILDELKVAQ